MSYIFIDLPVCDLSLFQRIYKFFDAMRLKAMHVNVKNMTGNRLYFY